MKNVMIDLETMGVKTDAAILAIGAVEFDFELNKTGRTFYTNVDLQSCLDLGLSVDASTIYWWLQQSEEARKALIENAMDIKGALTDLRYWIQSCGCVENVWAQGTDFDITLLKTAYSKAGYKLPWKYNAARDTRTYYDALDAWPETTQYTGTAHNALDDAINQACGVMAAHRKHLRVLGRIGYSETDDTPF